MREHSLRAVVCLLRDPLLRERLGQAGVATMRIENRGSDWWSAALGRATILLNERVN